ncbi:MAG: hypothetical protein RJA72_860, partial [Pseudomonadota bacterium]
MAKLWLRFTRSSQPEISLKAEQIQPV